MLRKLTVENYALIDRLELELTSSLNIITGETGAGKSILLGALGLILGNRAEGTAVLQDTTKNCIVEGTFDLTGYRLESFFSENDLDFATETVIRRIITPAGKSRSYINDIPVQLTTLRELGSNLVDIHAQDQHLLLGDERFRIRIIDALANMDGLLERYANIYRKLQTFTKEHHRLLEQAQQRRLDQEYLMYQVEQLSAAKLQAGEQPELEAQQQELSNAGTIRETLGQASDVFSNDDTGILPRLKTLRNELHRIADVYPKAAYMAERIQSAALELKDLSEEIAAEAERIEADPSRLQYIEERLNTIYALQQKHHATTVEELIDLEQGFKERLQHIGSDEELLSTLERQVKETSDETYALAKQITDARQSASESLTSQIEAILTDLGMPHARFMCQVTPLEKLSLHGVDDVRFLFTANKNGTLQPLEKIASGGELSRVMLSLKSIVARSAKLPTILFDEIDSGVSGRIADAMGNIIFRLSQHMQVIDITHLPQIASKGDTHFLVYKEDTEHRTRTQLVRLEPQERIVEIAKMLSGDDITEAALSQARLLLAK